tara:strand:- start:1157 stop:1741 length:585 start_codon:yes stop_codon:yes gene_type:complete
MNDIVSLFPTAVGIYNLDIDFEEFYSQIKEVEAKPHGLLEGSISTFDNHYGLLNNPVFDEVNGKLQEFIDDYTQKVGLQPLLITGSWYNEMTKGTKVTLHRHEGSVVSGAFYIHLDEDSVPLRFMSPLEPYKMNDMYDTLNTEYAATGVQFKPEQGTVFLFPSWLKHETDAECGERCVISFNTLYRSMFVNPDT